MADGASAQKTTHYGYVARDEGGQRVTGVLEAASEREARAALRGSGLYPISLEEAGPGHAPSARATPRAGSGARPLGMARQAAFLTSLARLVERKVGVERALGIIAQGRERGMPEIAGGIRSAIREGKPLPDALAEAGVLSDPAASALLRMGEASGDLPGALSTASRILGNRVAAGRRLVTSMLYPCVLLTVALVSVGLVLLVIIPKFRPLVEERFDLIPPLGRLVFALSGWLEALWPLLLLVGIAFAATGVILARRGKLGAELLAVARRLPLVGGAISDNRTMLTLRVLGSLLERRLPLVQALQVLAAAPPDPQSLSRIRSAATRIEKGDTLSSAFEAESLAPAPAIEMIRIGEETGDLGGMMLRAADDLEEASARQLERMLTLVEPVLIAFVGLIVGISLYALFTAITSVNTLSF